MASIDNLESKSCWQLAIETAQIGVWDSDLVNESVFYSDEWKRIRGLEKTSLRGSMAEGSDRIHPDDNARRQSLLEKLILGETERYEFEHRVRHNNGDWIRILEKVQAVRNAEGIPIRLIGCDSLSSAADGDNCQAFSDSTTDDLSFAELERQHRMIRSIADNTSDIIGFATPDREILYLNRTGREMLPQMRESANRKDFLNAYPKSAQKLILEEAVPKAIENGRWKGEIDFLSNGKEIPVSHELIAHKRPDGTLEGISTITRDLSERKAVELALLTAKTRLERVANNIPGTIFQYVLHPDGRQSCPYASSKALQMYGATPAAITENIELLWRWLHPEDINAIREAVIESARWLETFDVEYRVLPPGGSERWYHALSHPERLENGDVVWHGVAMDITERKAAQLELEVAKNQHESTADNVAGMVYRYTVHPDGKHTVPYATNAISQLFGVTAEEVFDSAEALWRWLNPEDALRVQEALTISAKNLSRYSEQYEVNPPGEASRWYQSIGMPKRLGNGSVTWDSVVINITDQKNVELALLETQSQFERIAENIPGVIYRVIQHADGTKSATHVSSHCRELFGVGPEELTADPDMFFNLVHPDDVRCLEEKMQQSAETLQPFKAEYRVQLPEKGLCWREDYGQPFQLENGDMVWDGVVLDITDRKLAELENDELAKAKKMKDEFLATMSHELRTPLNAILAMTEGLQQGVFGLVSEKQSDSLAIVEQSGLHLLELINEVLDLAKVESGQMKLEFTSVEVARLCESSLRLVSQQADQKNIQLNLQVPWNLPSFQADEKRLRQTLINLLSNAVKFTPEGGRVDVDARRLESSEESSEPILRISVTDTGVGIATERLSDLFEPFVQFESSLNRSYQGTGLGLALVKKFVDLHGGDVSVTSEIGTGSCFTVDLPYRDSSFVAVDASKIDSRVKKTTTSSDAKIDPHKGAGISVLLVEDNDNIAKVVCLFLESIGFTVTRVNEGEAAIAEACNQLPDVILMDIQMPVMDGIEATKRIRAIPELQETPIIALTGLAMPNDEDRCIEAGASLFMSKPYRIKDLADNIISLNSNASRLDSIA